MRRLADRPTLFVLAMGLIAALVVMFLLAMDASIRQAAVDRLGYGGKHSDEPGGSRDLFHTGVPIAGTKSGMTYASYDAQRDGLQARHFSGFGCVHSCERHEEGYRWAAGRAVKNPQNCHGTSWEFVEGCAAFALAPTDR